MRSAPHPFTLRQLQYALAVAEELSFRRAAERCAVSQPALSAQLAGLETALGVRLFERDRRGVILTREGAALLPRLTAALLAADDVVEAGRRLSDPLGGSLRLGVIPTISPYLLPSAVPALAAAFPRLSIAWTEEKTPELVRRLHAGELDGALLALEADLGDLERAVVAKDPFVLAAPARHPLGRKRGPATLEELAGAHVLLLDDGHCLRDQSLSFCARADLHERGFRATSLSTLVSMVAAGDAVTLLPSLAVATERRGGAVTIRPLARPAPGRTIGVVWRRGSPVGATLRKLAETLKAAYPHAA